MALGLRCWRYSTRNFDYAMIHEDIGHRSSFRISAPNSTAWLSAGEGMFFRIAIPFVPAPFLRLARGIVAGRVKNGESNIGKDTMSPLLILDVGNRAGTPQ